ncbi:MAG: methyltransferase domain-containing protein [Gammaproteobacteria bacterium]
MRLGFNAEAWISSRSDSKAATAASLTGLLDAASEPYRTAGRFAYYFARGKLRTDPVYRAILELGLLRGRTRVLDLGCGQGLLAAWLRAAEQGYERGSWPRGWPPAPQTLSTRGIELMARDVERARCAFGSTSEVSQADIRSASFGAVDAVVILDVLHYLNPQSQLEVLQRVRAALPAGGLLLLRVGDAGAGLRFRYGQLSDQLMMLMRGHPVVAQHCRSIAQWRVLLKECGFASEAQTMSQGTPFANVLLIAHAV